MDVKGRLGSTPGTGAFLDSVSPDHADFAPGRRVGYVIPGVLVAGILISVGAVVLGNVARADEMCADVNSLIKHAQTGFSDLTPQKFNPPNPPLLPDAENCRQVQLISGDPAIYCTWGFHYREADAYDTFRTFNVSLRQCLGQGADSGNDLPVNHPDTYEQAVFHLGQTTISVSLKDKAELGRTFVFVGIHSGRGS